MKLYYDLHIHSCLSPCAADSMTPNNVINMALLKGLDLIAVTDHNHIGNCSAFMQLAEEKDILLLPGIEVHTVEDVHILCYFKTMEDLTAFYEELPQMDNPILNDNCCFGTQLLVDKKDHVYDQVDNLLLFPLPVTIEEVDRLAKEHQGLAVPAHIHRSGYGLLPRLGVFPDKPVFTTIESHKGYENLQDHYHILHNSDAHRLGSINEKEYFLEVDKPSLKAILELLGSKKA